MDNRSPYNIDIIYKNELDTKKFSEIFSNTSQSYKFYWFEAILNLTNQFERDFTFDEIINEMIYEAWYTVTHYHLHLGPIVNGSAENFLEHIIIVLNKFNTSLPHNLSKEQILKLTQDFEKEIQRDKNHLADYVPYKLLHPFFETKGLEEGLKYMNKDQRERLVAYMNQVFVQEYLIYTILPGVGLAKKVRINKTWREFLLDNYSVINSWIQFNKAEFLQNRNPGVPGIIDKIFPENEDVRKLEAVRELWREVSKITKEPLREIYTGKIILEETLSIDHFIPRSYVANDEIWNLIPMSKKLNSSKNNKLPSWERFFAPFAEYQYYLYNLVFGKRGADDSDILKGKFKKCRKNNLSAIWAIENLYVEDNSREYFTNILSHNLKPVYESALMQGYEVWCI